MLYLTTRLEGHFPVTVTSIKRQYEASPLLGYKATVLLAFDCSRKQSRLCNHDSQENYGFLIYINYQQEGPSPPWKEKRFSFSTWCSKGYKVSRPLTTPTLPRYQPSCNFIVNGISRQFVRPTTPLYVGPLYCKTAFSEAFRNS